jgi:tRNA(Ile)-lysidine synthase
VVRPLLTLTRAEVRAAAVSAGLPFVDDRSNDDPAFARARIRNEVLPVLSDLNPSVLDAIASTRAELGEELDFIAGAAAGLIEAGATIEASKLEAAHPALRRHALRLLAERGLGRPVAIGRQQTERICRLAVQPEGGSIDLGGGDFLVAESGVVAVEREAGDVPAAATIPIPGSGTWYGWRIEAEPLQPPFAAEGPDVATLDADRLGDRIEVRGRREGDRIGPLGMTGSKSLQDLFTDAGLRRSLRRRHPVIVAAGEIAWVPGLAVGDRFRLRAGTRRAVRITARQDPPGAGARPGT